MSRASSKFQSSSSTCEIRKRNLLDNICAAIAAGVLSAYQIWYFISWWTLPSKCGMTCMKDILALVGSTVLLFHIGFQVCVGMPFNRSYAPLGTFLGRVVGKLLSFLGESWQILVFYWGEMVGSSFGRFLPQIAGCLAMHFKKWLQPGAGRR